ncbi:MAG: SpoIIE family protein phosphatase [Alphaproteobacteria bacterium]|nr:SpoIIE family protein phosphatase [Alphaproteobacteria bacterium]
MFIDIDCAQIKKFGQNAFGDYFISKRSDNQKRLIAVLSDGLGSGIKANILSCMTATMLARFIEEDISIRKAAQIIMDSLPICQIRKISYATFSAVDCRNDGSVWVVEEGNPAFVLMRKNEELPLAYKEFTSPQYPDRHLRLYRFQAEVGDRIIFCSDGVTQAGIGTREYPLGFQRRGLLTALKSHLELYPKESSSELAKWVIEKALSVEPEQHAGDDISCSVLYFRNPRKSLIFTGPPYNKSKDREYCLSFGFFGGKKAICGGTTANMISRELRREIVNIPQTECGDLPPVAAMDGVDLVTEGILTLTRAAEYLEREELQHKDAAGLLVKFLLESDIIEFMVGAMLNQAHYDPALPVEIEVRRTVIKKMKKLLEDKYFKQVTISYI